MAEATEEEEANAIAAEVAAVFDGTFHDCKWVRIREESNRILFACSEYVVCAEVVRATELELGHLVGKIDCCRSKIQGYEKQLKWARKVGQKETMVMNCEIETEKSILMSKIESCKGKLEAAESSDDEDTAMKKADYAVHLKMEKRMVKRWRSVGLEGVSEKNYHKQRKQFYRDLLAQFDRNEVNIGNKLVKMIEVYQNYNRELSSLTMQLSTAKVDHAMKMNQIDGMKQDLVGRMARCNDKWAIFLENGDIAALNFMLQFIDENRLPALNLVFAVGKTANLAISKFEEILCPLSGGGAIVELNVRRLYRLSSIGRVLTLEALSNEAMRSLGFKV